MLRRPLAPRLAAAEEGSSAAATTPASADALFKELDEILDDYRRAPISLVSQPAYSVAQRSRTVSALLIPARAWLSPTTSAALLGPPWAFATLQKQEVTGDVLTTVQRLADAGALKKWGAALGDLPERRSVFLGEGRRCGAHRRPQGDENRTVVRQQ